MTNDDFRTHRAPMPAPHMTGPTTQPFAAPTEEPCLSCAIDDQHDASRSNCPKRTRSQTAILAGNTPLCPDYRTAARSGFAASAASAPPPKASFRSSPPPRSAPLGSTIPLGCYASPQPKLASSKPRVGPLAPVAPPILQITAPDNNASAAAEPFLKTFTLGVHKLTTSFYSPRGNGGVKHVYSTMANILAMVCNEHQHNWDSHLSFWCTQTYDKRLLPDW